ncbi:hypothetical protein ACIRG5_41280 [Lentzea sp. NPDC102401]|uniref:hypothetical protein n=1 Tax=Lentzea sp. NPDC102401 TaxID=3364128 RepID=UPI0037FA090D
MGEAGWVKVPIGVGAERWVTLAGLRTVLVVVHTLPSGQRLLDVVEHIETDQRIQVVFTPAPDVFDSGVIDWLRSLGALVVPWQQAIQQRFDLALTASYGGLGEIHAPRIVLPHGAGYGKLAPQATGKGPRTRRQVYGLDAQRLTRDGRVLADVLVLSTNGQRSVLRAQCPEALSSVLVAGDPCYDKLRASTHLRKLYREALCVQEDQQLVLIASTWGAQSLFARSAELMPRLLQQLDNRKFRIAALLHPGVWFGHGRRQVLAWLSEYRRAGLTVLTPEVDWRAAVIGADVVIGDHGSIPVYAACARVPVLTVDGADTEVAPWSANALLAHHAPRLTWAAPIEPQLLAAAEHFCEDDYTAITAAVTSKPDQAVPLLRNAIYHQLGLPEPGRHRQLEPVAVPTRLD